MFDFRFEWRPEMETHIESIDTQHKQLFSYGRDIEQAIKIGCVGVTEKQLMDIVIHLREYVSYNTYEEENIMKEIQYKNIVNHRNSHNKFVQKIMLINIVELKEKPLEKLSEIKDMIVDYIFTHILTEDIKMSKAYISYKNEMKTIATKEELKEKIIQQSLEEKTREDLFGYRICNLDVTEVYLYKNQTREGEMVAVFKGSVVKLLKLNALQRSAFFSDIDRIGKVIDKLYNPDAIDYISMGDVNGRLHFHIIPKRKTDHDWGSPSLPMKNEDTLSNSDYQKIISKLSTLLIY